MPMLSFKTRLTVHYRDQFTCQYCGILIHPLSENLSIDHANPDGGDEMENLATCCRTCNSAKGKMPAEEFRRKLNGLKPSPGANEPTQTLQEILVFVANSHSTTPKQIVAKSNRRHLVRLRAEVVRLARAEGYSLSEIGELLNKHHTTILHLLNKYGNLNEESK